ncbi:hypothetical protein GCK72_006381 [Caenorhabditis remanei]|uniref:Uncharacterized protein n=1 Tax=Caenorhabditis remanei TaxID=31234 RepID=A0A6A5HIF3_CAERE|nr:hypothetical protein GCK72_006381 [Caenorhabditis remanei]KAF1766424.1 hypothetical protein GCK72_006381 [Caenorhabditis remanei]
MMRKSAGYEAKAYTSEDAEIPRKCVVIHKKKIGNTMEKIELRYVAYNRIENGVHSTTMEVINDASTYFKDRAEDLDYQNDSLSQSSLQKTVTIAKSEEKEKKNKEKLEQCLPLLMENEKNSSYSAHNRSQNGALKVLCDEIVAEATYEINNGHPISSDLIKKIANINTLSRQVIAKESKLESLVPDENELAASKSKTSDKFAK